MTYSTAPASAAQALAELRELLASDAYAITFPSIGAYRVAMLRAADNYLHDLTTHVPATFRPIQPGRCRDS